MNIDRKELIRLLEFAQIGIDRDMCYTHCAKTEQDRVQDLKDVNKLIDELESIEVDDIEIVK